MAIRDDLVALLARHQGADQGISAEAIARALGVPTRRVRTLASEARMQGIAVCAHPAKGYFIAANEEELNRYYIRFMYSRAMHTLKLIAIAKRIPLPELIGQMRLPT